MSCEHNAESTMQVKVRHPKMQEHDDAKGWEYAIKVANFIKKTKWCQQGGEDVGGIPGATWIELFVLFKMHDQTIEQQTFLYQKIA